jgi:hypothetical protein
VLFSLVGLDFELRALSLQSWHSTAWNTPPVHFALVILDRAICKLLPGLPQTKGKGKFLTLMKSSLLLLKKSSFGVIAKKFFG